MRVCVRAEKREKKVAEQAKKLIAKKVKEMVVVVMVEKKKAKSCKNTNIDEYLLKIEEDYSCEQCLKGG